MASAADWFQPPAGQAAPSAGAAEGGLPLLSTVGPLTSGVAASVAQNLLASGREHADSWFGSLFSVERFKPYFDVDGPVIARRCLYALLPRTSASTERIDLYGPCMIVFSLVVLLHYSFVITHAPNTHLTVSFGLAITLWIAACLAQLAFCYMSGTALSVLQIVAFTGYAFFAVNVSLLVGFVHFFQPVAVTLSVLSALSLATTFYGASSNQVKGTAIAACAFGVQLLLNLFLSSWFW